ncbi:MAG: hypothetical protein WAV00_21005 [Nocardioides sp.]
MATGPGPTRATQPYRVEVVDERLALVLDATGSPVLRAPLRRVRARPLGRAGAVVVEVDGAPLLLDFTERRHPGTGPAHVVRRATHALWGRRVRHAFLAAARGTR